MQPPVQPHRHLRRTGRYILHDRERSPVWVWLLVILATLLAIGVIGSGVGGLAIFVVYKPQETYLYVSHAHFRWLEHGAQLDTIGKVRISIDMVAKNRNSKADVSFTDFSVFVGFQGADVAVLRAKPFRVPRNSSKLLPYFTLQAREGRLLDLDAARARAMHKALRAGLVPLDIFGQARMTWKVGVFPTRDFWTRISCRLYFSYPDGNALTIDPLSCRSWSP